MTATQASKARRSPRLQGIPARDFGEQPPVCVARPRRRRMDQQRPVQQRQRRRPVQEHPPTQQQKRRLPSSTADADHDGEDDADADHDKSKAKACPRRRWRASAFHFYQHGYDDDDTWSEADSLFQELTKKPCDHSSDSDDDRDFYIDVVGDPQLAHAPSMSHGRCGSGSSAGSQLAWPGSTP